MKMTENFKKNYKDIVNGYVYVGKNILIFKIIYDM